MLNGSLVVRALHLQATVCFYFTYYFTNYGNNYFVSYCNLWPTGLFINLSLEVTEVNSFFKVVSYNFNYVIVMESHKRMGHIALKVVQFLSLVSTVMNFRCP